MSKHRYMCCLGHFKVDYQHILKIILFLYLFFVYKIRAFS